MKILLLIVVYVINSCFAKFGRIIGGNSVQIYDYPYQVSIAHTQLGHFCGGVIYKSKVIITAAHCVYDTTISEILVRAGSTERSKGGFVSTVEKILISDLWNSEINDGDIAVLILKDSLSISEKIQPIELTSKEPKVGDIAEVSGWGTLSYEQAITDIPQLPMKLHAVTVPVFDWNECNNLLNGKLTKYMFCAGLHAGGKDSCQMDSGGPLVINNKLSGIVSWGIHCAEPNLPGVYTNVKKFVDWINKVSE